MMRAASSHPPGAPGTGTTAQGAQWGRLRQDPPWEGKKHPEGGQTLNLGLTEPEE